MKKQVFFANKKSHLRVPTAHVSLCVRNYFFGTSPYEVAIFVVASRVFFRSLNRQQCLDAPFMFILPVWKQKTQITWSWFFCIFQVNLNKNYELFIFIILFVPVRRLNKYHSLSTICSFLSIMIYKSGKACCSVIVSNENGWLFITRQYRSTDCSLFQYLRIGTCLP